MHYYERLYSLLQENDMFNLFVKYIEEKNKDTN